jgi:HK97 family phage prohead protease
MTSIGTLRGYPVAFNTKSLLIGGMFFEEIDPAVAQDLPRDDQYAVVNHDDNKVLGRVSAGTLVLTPDTRGIRAEIDMPDTSYSRDAMESHRRGDAPGWSFRFSAARDEWRLERGSSDPIRRVLSMRLLEVSPLVPVPAYPITASLRGQALPTRYDRHDRLAAELALRFVTQVTRDGNLALRMRVDYRTASPSVEWRTVPRPGMALARARQRQAEAF